jgi:hypothetical protein
MVEYIKQYTQLVLDCADERSGVGRAQHSQPSIQRPTLSSLP